MHCHTDNIILSYTGAGEMTGENIEVAIVGEDKVFRVLTPSEVADYLQEVE